jgi:hypothetical protein
MGCESPDAAIFIAHSFRPEGHVQDIMRSRPNLVPAGHRSPAGELGDGCCALHGHRRGLVAAPAELATVRPHAMQNHRELARDRYRRAAQATPLGKRGAPSLQR